MRRAVESRNLVSFVVSAAVGLYLFRSWPFPAENDLLQMVLIQKPYLFYGIKYGFVAMLFSTPYIAFSILFSFTYIFVMRREEQIGARRLASYLPPETRNDLYLVVGELHHPKRPQPAAAPQWLIVPERGLFTGIAIFGAVGSGKTTGCMYPVAEQVLAFRAAESEHRVSGLVLEDTDSSERVSTLSQHGECLEGRKEAATHSLGTTGMVSAKDPRDHPSASRDHQRLSKRRRCGNWATGKMERESKAKAAIEVITGSDAAKPAIPGSAGPLNFNPNPSPNPEKQPQLQNRP